MRSSRGPGNAVICDIHAIPGCRDCPSSALRPCRDLHRPPIWPSMGRVRLCVRARCDPFWSSGSPMGQKQLPSGPCDIQGLFFLLPLDHARSGFQPCVEGEGGGREGAWKLRFAAVGGSMEVPCDELIGAADAARAWFVHCLGVSSLGTLSAHSFQGQHAMEWDCCMPWIRYHGARHARERVTIATLRRSWLQRIIFAMSETPANKAWTCRWVGITSEGGLFCSWA